MVEKTTGYYFYSSHRGFAGHTVLAHHFKGINTYDGEFIPVEEIPEDPEFYDNEVYELVGFDTIEEAYVARDEPIKKEIRDRYNVEGPIDLDNEEWRFETQGYGVYYCERHGSETPYWYTTKECETSVAPGVC